MKKLIKISGYYYVIDTETKIKENDYYICDEQKLENDYLVTKNFYKNFQFKDLTNATKIITTTDPSLSLPQITNPSDELELMIDKEVEVEFELLYCNNSCDETIEVAIIKPITKSEIIKNHCKEKRINFINIPISKETSLRLSDDDIFGETSTNETLLDEITKITSKTYNVKEELSKLSTNESLEYEPELFNDDSTVTFTVKEVREISTNLLKEYDAKLTENPYNKGNYVSFWDYMKKNYRDRFINTSKTNETLEEVAEKESQNYVKYTDEYFKFNLAEAYRLGFLSGYKYAEKTMIKVLLSYNKYLFTFIDSDNVGIDVSEQSVINWFNNKK